MKNQNLKKFESELEFIQLLSNPEYTLFIYKTYKSDINFFNYLKYLRYFGEEPYVFCLIYPQCLLFLEYLIRIIDNSNNSNNNSSINTNSSNNSNSNINSNNSNSNVNNNNEIILNVNEIKNINNKNVNIYEIKKKLEELKEIQIDNWRNYF